MITIRHAAEEDAAFWLSADAHDTREGFLRKARSRLAFLICEDGAPIGLLDYCPLWNHLPFLNLIYLLPPYRGRGAGGKAMALWEEEMSALGYTMVLTSTQSDENAQFFYRRLHYRDCGVLVLNDCPLAQPAELFFCKTLPSGGAADSS